MLWILIISIRRQFCIGHNWHFGEILKPRAEKVSENGKNLVVA
jgi:hypothetical protein